MGDHDVYKLWGVLIAAAHHNPATNAPAPTAGGRVAGKRGIQFLVVQSPTSPHLSVERSQEEGGVELATGGLVEPDHGDQDEAGDDELGDGDVDGDVCDEDKDEEEEVKSGRMPM